MNRILSSDFFWGIIIGVVLTIFGAYLQSQLYEIYDSRKFNNELSILTCRNVNSRNVRSLNMITSSSSSVFEDRWADYISEGVYPWNSDRAIMEHFIKKEYPDLVSTFNSITKKFADIHDILSEIRQLQGAKSDSTKVKLKNYKELANKKYREIQPLVSQMEVRLLNF